MIGPNPWQMPRAQYFKDVTRRSFPPETTFAYYRIRGFGQEDFCWQKAWDFAGYHREVGQFWITARQIQRSGRLDEVHPTLWAEYHHAWNKFFRENPELGEVEDRQLQEEFRDMQSFLPYADFAESLRCLDNQRLGKQRVGAWQIIRTILGHNAGGWRNHPAVKMWQGSVHELMRYYNLSLDEWEGRGFVNNMERCHIPMPWNWADASYHHVELFHPPWLGMPEFHASHRAALLAKKPAYYAQFGWTEEPSLEYFWPV